MVQLLVDKIFIIVHVQVLYTGSILIAQRKEKKKSFFLFLFVFFCCWSHP